MFNSNESVYIPFPNMKSSDFSLFLQNTVQNSIKTILHSFDIAIQYPRVTISRPVIG